MAGCITKCTSFSRDSIQAAWEDIRDHFGPRVSWSEATGSLASVDVATWTAWATTKGVDPNNVNVFGNWLIWFLSYGTVEYGNLPTRKRDHEGISCIPCPYSNASSAVRTRLVLGLEESSPIPTQTDHGTYYMKISARGGAWGFECTSPTCPYYLDNGRRFFYV